MLGGKCRGVVTAEAEFGSRCLELLRIGGLMDVVAGKAITFGYRRVNDFFGRLAFMTDGTELFPLASELERPLLVRVGLAGRPVAGDAIISGNRAMDELLPHLALVAAGPATVGKARQAVCAVSATACLDPAKE